MNMKWGVTLFLSLFFLFFAPLSLAHPGNTDSYGCHTCRTNCPNWSLYYGQYHCHNSKPSYTATPSCPSFSTYSYLSKNCECLSGYVASGNSCISAYSYCTNKLGYGATYNYSSGSCECSSSYIYSGGKCVSGYSYCTNKYGYGARYNSLNDNCECGYNYVFKNGRCQWDY